MEIWLDQLHTYRQVSSFLWKKMKPRQINLNYDLMQTFYMYLWKYRIIIIY